MSEYLIEAGHFYSCNGPSNISLKLWSKGKKLAKELGGQTALFIDNYHDSQTFLAEGEEFLDQDVSKIVGDLMIEDADHVFCESDMANLANVTAQTLLDQNLAKTKGDKLSAKGIKLGSWVGDELVPTCVLMDYVLLEQKAKIAPNNIILLPSVYTQQQNQLRTLTEHAQIVGLKKYEVFMVPPSALVPKGTKQ